MPITRNRFSALVAATALLTLAVTGPAYADGGDTKTAGACWIDTDRGTTQCFASVDAMQDAVLAQPG